MPLDVGRVTHLLEQMHRSEDDAGDPIVVDKVLVTDGARGFTWEDYGAGGGLDSFIALFLDHGDVGATETIDQSAAAVHLITLDDDCTLTFSGAVSTVDGDPVSCWFSLYVEQDATGGWAVTWPASVIWPNDTPPTLDTTPGSVEALAFYTLDGGTVWYGKHRDPSSASSDLEVLEQGLTITTAAASINFTGAGVTATAVGDAVTVDVPINGIGPILISDTPSTPLVFADLVQNEAQDDLVYADV